MRLKVILILMLPFGVFAQNQLSSPDEEWMRYTDVTEAGFSTESLSRAKTFWERSCLRCKSE